MLRLAFMTMGGLALVLGCIVIGEAWSAHGEASRAIVAAGPAPLRLTPGVPVDPGRTNRWVAAILARPLFTPSRRPARIAAVAGSSRAALPRLTGIMVSPEGRFAIFAPATGKPITVQPGARIGGFTVRGIARDRVSVLGPDGVETVRITYGDTPAASTSAAPTAPRATPVTAARGVPPGSLFAMPPMTRTAGGIMLGGTSTDLPSAATWSGPPPLSQLVPPPRPPLASHPLLPAGKPSAPAGVAAE
ncbi:hypothetical protein AruPA_03265 [Acidiphilium sp. PA]|uniref:hypothetical protein n=1 Tax=Acidiphilium sp. PA TaxID=2871705 RepID=UPI00224465FE|nr:hypothetical protein [Acidiphilium sp. PA]MCW8306046.1 hypothetical protein [Acidiphilium sp. PA]